MRTKEKKRTALDYCCLMLNTCVYFVEVVNWVLTASTWVMFVQSIFVCGSEFFPEELETARGSCLHAICGTNLGRQRITSRQRTANSPIRIDLQMLWFRHHDELMNFRLYKMDNIKLKRKENPWNYDSKHSSLNERSSTIFSNCNLILGRILFYF